MMDAATLYVIVTLSDGTQSTSTFGYSSLQACAASMEMLKEVRRADEEAPVNGYWCVENKPHVGFMRCNWRARGCEHFTMSTPRGCTALRWVVQMRDRSRTANCHVEGEERKRGDDKFPQPDPIDGNDVLKRH